MDVRATTNAPPAGTAYQLRDRRQLCHPTLITPPTSGRRRRGAPRPSVNYGTPGGRRHRWAGRRWPLSRWTVTMIDASSVRRAIASCGRPLVVVPLFLCRVIGPYGSDTRIICHFSLNLEVVIAVSSDCCC